MTKHSLSLFTHAFKRAIIQLFARVEYWRGDPLLTK